MSAPISQKEYLQKYLSSDDKLLHKKKKKKKDKEKPAVKTSTYVIEFYFDQTFYFNLSVFNCSVKIIDDDDHARFDPDPEIDEGELYALNEEAPQIVGVIDERAPEVLMKQEYMDSGKWKSLAANDKSKKKKKRRSPSVELVRSRDRDEVIDLSPPRRNRRDSQDTPVRRRRDSDASPPRRSIKRRDSTDNSPPRRSNVRKDESPLRRRRRDSDESPPRKQERRTETATSSYSKNRRDSPDISPPRKSKRDSSSRKSSPDRRKKSRWASKSPERRQRSPDNSPPRRVKVEQDSSPPRRRRESPPKRVKEEPESPPRSSKMSKTLEGKAAGLQNAKDLKAENEAHRRRQDELYRKLDPSLSGRHAKEIAVRDVRGRNKEYAKNYEKDRRKAEEEEIRKQKYDKWNKGIKQLEEIEKKRQEWAHEASKPLARAADDEDLEHHLKDQERLDDPMLEYMRSKKKKQDKKDGVMERPQYQGQFPDNRFHIRPGYRWDGVDRSNGYEKKYFNMLSAKQSFAEEAYKYSVEDM